MSSFFDTKDDTSQRKDYIGDYFDSIEPYDITLFQAMLFNITCCICCKRYNRKLVKLKARYHAAKEKLSYELDILEIIKNNTQTRYITEQIFKKY